MKRNRKQRCIAAAVLLSAFVLAGCGKESKSRMALQENISVEEYSIEEDDTGSLRASVTVTLPDYSYYMEQCAKEAAKSTEKEQELEERLYELTARAAEKGDAFCTKEMVLNLSEIDEKKTADKWKDADIEAAAREAAFDEELEEFCLRVMAGYYGSSPQESEVGTE